MLVDLHTHTTVSDGELSPAELVDRARGQGVDLLSITDHDSVGAYAQLDWENFSDIRLVPGVEFSCTWSGVNIHVLGLGIDPRDPALVTELGLQAQRRRQRAEVIAQRLGKLGISGALDGAAAFARGREIGRPDFARYLVESGHVATMTAAFDRYLGAGKAGDVKSVWPEMTEVVSWIRAAGGVAAVAHPMQYKMTNAKLRRLLTAFQQAGGEGLEVANGRQPEIEQRYLRGLCRHYGFEATLGSDFHQPSNYLEVGAVMAALGDCQPIWQRWL